MENEFKKGWTVLFSCFIGVGVSLVSLIYYSNGIWIKPLEEEFGWSRAEIGLGQGLGMLTLVIGAPFAGWLIDRFGLKKTISLSLLLYGCCIYLFSKMDGSLWMYYGLSILLVFLALPSTPIGFTRVVNAWFDKHRGLALGISLTATGLGGFFIPKYLTPYVAENGWREGYVLLFYIVLIGIPFVWFFLKDNPIMVRHQTEEADGFNTNITIKEAIRTPTFWKLGVIFLIIATAVLGFIPSLIPLIQDAGMSPSEAGKYAAILGLSVVVGRLLTGFLIDRFFAPYVLTIIYILVASGCLALGLGGIQFILWASIAFGFAIGAEVDLIGYFTAKYFGLNNYGTLYGLLYSIFSLGAAISTVSTGLIWDKTGSYDLALYIAAALLILASIISLFLPRFQTKL